ncbi:hypothetical protein [Pseudomonas putida]|nr:hypothetical protein [Pseudomonas putida]
MDEKLETSLSGEALTLNGEVFDFAPLEDGATLPQEAIISKWIAGPVERVGGELRLTIILPHGPTAPETTRYPQPLIVRGDGAISLPIYDIPQQAVTLIDKEEQQ